MREHRQSRLKVLHASVNIFFSGDMVTVAIHTFFMLHFPSRVFQSAMVVDNLQSENQQRSLWLRGDFKLGPTKTAKGRVKKTKTLPEVRRC